MDKEYWVNWEMAIEASSPEEAAKMALEIQHDPSSLATIFVVEDPETGDLIKVDVDEIEEA